MKPTGLSAPNPFASPNEIAVPRKNRSGGVQKLRSPRSAFGMWLAICAISAGPSFLLALGLNPGGIGIAGMLIAVLLFVFALSYVDLKWITPQFHNDIRMMRALSIGYKARVIFSIVPILMGIDMLLGSISVQTVGMIGDFKAMEFARFNGTPHDVGPVKIFLAFFLTTIMQGFLLNLVVLSFCGVTWCVLALFGVPTTGGRANEVEIVDETERQAQLAALSNGTYEEVL